ncbi:MAG: DUF86 domain-containing protein [Chloroflexi bacterium]|nr:DUF86 domain-containing protein [Chloroflexota bacterium]
MRRDEVTLLDIARAARLVQEFVQGKSEEEFLDDPKTQSSVLYQLIVVGEAVKRLSEDFRNQHPEIPWGLMAGMRDHVIHGYDAIDWDEAWNTATVDVPDLLDKLIPLLPTQSET